MAIFTVTEDVFSDIQLIDLNHRDAQFVRAELIERIDNAVAAAIAAAVAAEREACAVICDESGQYHIERYDALAPESPERYACIAQVNAAETIAAAIRARNGRE